MFEDERILRSIDDRISEKMKGYTNKLPAVIEQMATQHNTPTLSSYSGTTSQRQNGVNLTYLKGPKLTIFSRFEK